MFLLHPFRAPLYSSRYDRETNVIEEAYLEAALLVASGYELEKVKQWMIKLGRSTKLKRYRRNEQPCMRAWGPLLYET
jgi:hypothetical protein